MVETVEQKFNRKPTCKWLIASCWFSHVFRICDGHRVKEDEIGEACSPHGRKCMQNVIKLPEEIRSVGICRLGWDGNIKTVIKEIGC